MAARGKTIHAACRAIRIPLKTITNWAGQPGGAKLRDALAQAPDLVRGFFEDEMRKTTWNKNYNTALAGKFLGANFDEYRSVAQPLPADLPQRPDGMTDFEFERRLLAVVDRIKAARDTVAPAPQLPAGLVIEHDAAEGDHHG